MEKTYKIVGRTNGWIAQRDIMFKGKTEITIERGMTLREAQKKLLDFFNEDYDKSYSNWGLVRSHHHNNTASLPDGTRFYEYDSRYYYIEEEDELWYCSTYQALDEDGNVNDDIHPDCDYFKADNDKEAVEHAKELAEKGVHYSDIGYVELELLQVCRVDPYNEWEEVETVWY